MLCIVAEGASHAAATRVDHIHIIAEEPQHFDGGGSACWQTIVGESLRALVAMRVESDFFLECGSLLPRFRYVFKQQAV